MVNTTTESQSAKNRDKAETSIKYHVFQPDEGKLFILDEGKSFPSRRKESVVSLQELLILDIRLLTLTTISQRHDAENN